MPFTKARGAITQVAEQLGQGVFPWGKAIFATLAGRWYSTGARKYVLLTPSHRLVGTDGSASNGTVALTRQTCMVCFNKDREGTRKRTRSPSSFSLMFRTP